MIKKTLKPEEYSEARKQALREKAANDARYKYKTLDRDFYVTTKKN